MLGSSSSPIRRGLRRFAAEGRRARGDDRGNAIIEFALIVPAFFALLLAIIQTAIVFLAQESLETAAEAAARQITTGQINAANDPNGTAFNTAACNGLQAFMPCANLMVDVQSSGTFNGVNTSTPTITYDAHGNVNNAWQFTPGSAGSIVVVRLLYIWSTTSGPLNFSLGNLSGNQRLLVATTVAKTEPYN